RNSLCFRNSPRFLNFFSFSFNLIPCCITSACICSNISSTLSYFSKDNFFHSSIYSSKQLKNFLGASFNHLNQLILFYWQSFKFSSFCYCLCMIFCFFSLPYSFFSSFFLRFHFLK